MLTEYGAEGHRDVDLISDTACVSESSLEKSLDIPDRILVYARPFTEEINGNQFLRVPCRIPLALSGRRFLSTTKPKSGTALGGYRNKMALDLSEEKLQELMTLLRFQTFRAWVPAHS
jgi:hypothetical protein